MPNPIRSFYIISPMILDHGKISGRIQFFKAYRLTHLLTLSHGEITILICIPDRSSVFSTPNKPLIFRHNEIPGHAHILSCRPIRDYAFDAAHIIPPLSPFPGIFEKLSRQKFIGRFAPKNFCI